MRAPGPDGAAKVKTTRCGPNAFTAIGLLLTRRPSAMGPCTAGSVAALTENSTSSASNGVPSDHVTPSRRSTVIDFPSGAVVHADASHGSGSDDRRLIFTSGACVSRLNRCVGKLFRT